MTSIHVALGGGAMVLVAIWSIRMRSRLALKPIGIRLPLARTLQHNPQDDSFTMLLGDGRPSTDLGQVIWKVKPKAENLPSEERLQSMYRDGKWDLVMESGAEYSYWTCELHGGKRYDVEVVSTVTEKLIHRYTAQTKPKQLIRETKEAYSMRTKESPEWVVNIIRGLKEVDRVLVRVDDPEFGYVVAADSKWRDFPDPKTMPYMLGIAQNAKLFTIRELRVEHVPMLEAMKRQCLEILRDRFGVEDAATVRCFIHYPPQFDWLHVHFCLVNDPRGDAAVERAHLLEDVCDRLRENSVFYADATLTMRI